MKVQLLNKNYEHDSLSILIKSIRTCWDSEENSDSVWNFEYPNISKFVLGEKDKKLVHHILKEGHTSTLEHLVYTFEIKGISRFNLQELVRHRHASLSVKSSRYTLKELKNEKSFIEPDIETNKNRASKFINFIGYDNIDTFSIHALENVRKLIEQGIPNDRVKMCLPECYKVNLIWTINARSLMNFLTLRLSIQAHFEIKELAKLVYKQIPDSHKFLFADSFKN